MPGIFDNFGQLGLPTNFQIGSPLSIDFRQQVRKQFGDQGAAAVPPPDFGQPPLGSKPSVLPSPGFRQALLDQMNPTSPAPVQTRGGAIPPNPTSPTPIQTRGGVIPTRPTPRLNAPRTVPTRPQNLPSSIGAPINTGTPNNPFMRNVPNTQGMLAALLNSGGSPFGQNNPADPFSGIQSRFEFANPGFNNPFINNLLTNHLLAALFGGQA